MKILFALDKYLRREGGADRLARGVVRVLVEAGHEVRVVQTGPEAGELLHHGATVVTQPLPRPWLLRDGDYTMLRWNALWFDLVRREVESFAPGLLLTQNMLAPASVSAARLAGVRTALFFHGYRGLSPTFFRGQDALTAPAPSLATVPWRVKLKWPLAAKALDLHRRAFRAAGTVVANSDYSAGVIQRFCERPARVLYPIVDLQPPAAEPGGPPPDGPVLFVKPQPIKGVELFLALAAALPQQRFVAVGGAPRRWRRRLRRPANVEHLSWTDDMDALYARSSLLLVPSQIPEPFGRVLVEAGLHGVPAVASRTGAIPEVVGQGGLLVPPDAAPGAWAAAVTDARNPVRHASLAEKARARAEQHLAVHDRARLLQVLGLA
jgi:glycosyltransferase involved in cell wall biosynthesis